MTAFATHAIFSSTLLQYLLGLRRTQRSIEASSIASIAPKVFRQERQKYCWAPTLASPQRSPPLPSADPSNSYTLSILTTTRLHPTSLYNPGIVVTKNNYPHHNTRPNNTLQVYTGIESLLKFGFRIDGYISLCLKMVTTKSSSCD